jgi:hypothetical protein
MLDPSVIREYDNSGDDVATFGGNTGSAKTWVCAEDGGLGGSTNKTAIGARKLRNANSSI